MKTNKTISKILAITMAVSMVLPSFAYADGKVTKEETVYVNLNNRGEDIQSISSIWLHSDSPLKTVEDKSNLKDVVNVKGNEVPEIKNGRLIWKTDNTDLYYQGKAEKKLPISADIKYFLDGKEVDVEEIVGKSGKFKISIDLENTDNHNINIEDEGSRLAYTPYMVATVVDLPMNKFKNVNTNTGKIVSDGSNQIITFLSFPGLKDSLGTNKNILDLEDSIEITADVESFEMKPIVFTATSEIPEINGLDDAKNLDELIDGVNKIAEASEKLADAVSALYDGQVELNNGINELVDGMEGLKFGSNSLLDGTVKLNEGINSSYLGSVKINEGAGTLSKSANELGNGFVGLGEGMVEFSSKAVEFSQGASKTAEGASAIANSTKELNAGMKELIQGTETIKTGQDSLSEGLAKSLEGLEEIKKGKEKEGKVIELLLKGVEGLETAAETVGKLPGGDKLAEKMLAGLGEQKMALEGLKNSSSQLIQGIEQIEAGITEAEKASKELAKGIENVNNGQKKIGGGLGQLDAGTEGLREASNQLVEGSNGLQEGANTINENSHKVSAGAGKFTEGAKGLAKGTNDLSNGLKELDAGSSTLYKGVNELNKGVNALADGGGKLKEGSHKLTEGTSQLNDGMNEFYNEGILKISEEVNNADLDIAKIIDIKDELVKLAKDNKSFTGISEDMDGNLKFIMKTEGIKYEEKEEKTVVEEADESEENGFVAWIKGIFKK